MSDTIEFLFAIDQAEALRRGYVANSIIKAHIFQERDSREVALRISTSNGAFNLNEEARGVIAGHLAGKFLLKLRVDGLEIKKKPIFGRDGPPLNLIVAKAPTLEAVLDAIHEDDARIRRELNGRAAKPAEELPVYQPSNDKKVG